MKHHNKHFMGAFSVIVLVMILTGVLLSTHNLHGFDVTGMATVQELIKSSINIDSYTSIESANYYQDTGKLVVAYEDSSYLTKYTLTYYVVKFGRDKYIQYVGEDGYVYKAKLGENSIEIEWFNGNDYNNVNNNNAGWYITDNDHKLLSFLKEIQPTAREMSPSKLYEKYGLTYNANTYRSDTGIDDSIPIGYTQAFISNGNRVEVYDQQQTFWDGNNQVSGNWPTKSGQIFVYNDKNKIIAAYNLVTDSSGNVYYATQEDGVEKYYDLDLNEYTLDQTTNTLVPTNKKSDVLTNKMSAQIMKSDISIISSSITSGADYNHNKALVAFAKELGYTDEKTMTAISNEESAVNKYLYLSANYQGMRYDITTDTFSGQIDDKTTISWDSKGDTMYVESGNTKIYVVEQKGKDVYYQQTKTDQGWTDGKPIADTKQKADAAATYKAAEKQYDQLKEDKESAMKNGLITDKEGTAIKTSVREQAYLNKIYNELEAQFVGKVTGYLSKVIDNWLGLEGWSRGVPAGICKNIFGLEYYRNSGWISVPGNSSSSQLQSMLISHSNTIIIEGEKQEITETMYRYAYTIKLLANQSVEWKTYLYNSCSQENSEEQFYDYGALGAGEYYSFHYAGDTTFDCSAGQCLYDQACVALSDGSSPVCVSLTNGEGFETPQAGSDYDCAIT